MKKANRTAFSGNQKGSGYKLKIVIKKPVTELNDPFLADLMFPQSQILGFSENS